MATLRKLLEDISVGGTMSTAIAPFSRRIFDAPLKTRKYPETITFKEKTKEKN